MAKPIDLFYDWLNWFVKLASEAEEVNWSTQQLDNQKQSESALPLTISIMLVYQTVVDHAMLVASLNPLYDWWISEHFYCFVWYIVIYGPNIDDQCLICI